MREQGGRAQAETAPSIRVFIVAEHGVLRGALRALLEGQLDMQVVGDAVTGAAAEAALQLVGPDVAVVDTGLSDAGGMGSVIAVTRSSPTTRVIAINAPEEPAHVQAALAAGTAGYLVRSAGACELLAAIRAVAEGRLFIDAAFQEGVIGIAGRAGPYCRDARDGSSPLTPREREVMVRVAEGYTNSQIAQELNLGVKSIETYRARLMDKLGLSTRADLVRFALRSGALTASKPFS